MRRRVAQVWRRLVVKITGDETTAGGYLLQSDAVSKIVLTDGASFLKLAEG